jgi:hypothetical protein
MDISQAIGPKRITDFGQTYSALDQIAGEKSGMYILIGIRDEEAGYSGQSNGQSISAIKSSVVNLKGYFCLSQKESGGYSKRSPHDSGGPIPRMKLRGLGVRSQELAYP